VSRPEPRWLGRLQVDVAHVETLREAGGMHGIRDENLLESAIARPRQRWAYEPMVSIAELGAAYAFGLVRNHPYVDGNKRVGLIVLGAFSLRNGFRLTATEPEALEMFLALAAGAVSEAELAAWADEHTGPIKPGR
jgi:death-on-curing protein